MEHQEYKIRIDGIGIVSKSLNNFKLFDNDVFNHQLKTQAVGDEGKNLVVVFVQVKINKINAPDIDLCELTTAIGFTVENFKDVFSKGDKDKYIIPNEVENLMKTISISTTRGIMFSEFRGTLLHNAILPIILMDTLKPIESIVK